MSTPGALFQKLWNVLHRPASYGEWAATSYGMTAQREMPQAK